MQVSYRYLRLRLVQAGLFPATKLAWAAWYVLGIDLLLAVVQVACSALKWKFGESLEGWISFLSFLAIVLFLILALRWIKAKLLWRLRNRLIVTYVFIGVIPVVLLVGLAALSFYLFAGQFSTFIVTTELNSELKSLETANSALAMQLAGQFPGREAKGSAEQILGEAQKAWPDREMSVWLNRKLVASVPAVQSSPTTLPERVKGSFASFVRDKDTLYLRTAQDVSLPIGTLTVLSSEPFDSHLLEKLASNLGQVALFGTGISLQDVDQAPNSGVRIGDQSTSTSLSVKKSGKNIVLSTGKGLKPTLTAGNIPPASHALDYGVTFPTTVYVMDWDSGSTMNPAGFSVQTRISKLYERLFNALGDFAPSIEILLLFAAIVFALIELIALIIGTRLTRTVTGAVAQLYDATKHINRGDFSHRITVRSSDQIASLATSFNSMTASLEQLIAEQKEKQRLENELAIAQEVQAQLFPREISQLASLEVHGFCRPARTVSGDYYDFLSLDSQKLILAMGDISGKGISAALLMATIHSAVRAYSLERFPALHEPATVGTAISSRMVMASGLGDVDISPAALLAMLNHQLYQSTPAEKYATLFLGVYDGETRKLTFSNGGHLPPIVMAEDGTVRRLDTGGTVVGLFDQQNYQENSVQLQKGEMFVAFSDGVTEPENDFGEFGEERLIELLRENRGLALPRISEIVTAAVDDWIGANEQPDDVTIVLARAR